MGASLVEILLDIKDAPLYPRTAGGCKPYNQKEGG